MFIHSHNTQFVGNFINITNFKSVIINYFEYLTKKKPVYIMVTKFWSRGVKT